MSNFTIVEAEFTNKDHVEGYLEMTSHYADDRMGMGRKLTDSEKAKLIKELKSYSGKRCFLAFGDEQCIGIATCFYGFSTFYASRLINIHDLAVHSDYRGNGIGKALLAKVEAVAKDEGLCKITLEVREDNPAKGLYERTGFSTGDHKMFFMSKELT